MSRYACIFGVIITVFQVGRNPTSGKWTFPCFYFKKQDDNRKSFPPLQVIFIYFQGSRWKLSRHNLYFYCYIKRDSLNSELLPFYRPDTVTSCNPHCQTRLPDRLLKYCCVLSCAVLCCAVVPSRDVLAAAGSGAEVRHGADEGGDQRGVLRRRPSGHSLVQHQSAHE